MVIMEDRISGPAKESSWWNSEKEKYFLIIISKEKLTLGSQLLLKIN